MTDTIDAAGPNAAQAAYWNETAGPTWVELQDALDAQIEGVGLAAMAWLAPSAGERLVDVGCGCGATTLELARRVGAGGSVLGADISAPMLAVAARRAAAAGLIWASFVEADAQTYPFPPVDGFFSRFGVMFFADPVAAFANMRRALKPGGRVVFLCWRSPMENPVMTTAAVAAAPLLPAPPIQPDPSAPGPFAFADKDRLAGILKGAGFGDVAIEPHDVKMGWRDVDTGLTLALKVGPLGAALRDRPELSERVIGAVRNALEAHRGPDGVMLDSATWIVRAA